MVCPSCDATFVPGTEVCSKDGAGLLEVPDAPLLTGTELEGRYQIGSVVGAGAMGTVYRAFQKSMDRDVAIKVLHPKYAHDPRAVKRFFREAQSASRLIHPNIVTVFDFGRSRLGHLYMVMELVEGWTLGDLIYYRAPLDVGLAASIARQVCDGLEHAHSHHTVHRDLKPDNVQLTKQGKRVRAKVLDFGIARMTRESSSVIQANQSTIEIAGTPAYMSPEQILGKAPDTRTDLYSLGIILFEMLTAVRPFEDDNSVTLCMKQLNDVAPTVESVLGEGKVPEVLSQLITGLLSKEVGGRPPTASDVAKVLSAFVGEDCEESLAAELQSDVPVGLSHAPTRKDGGSALAQVAAMHSGDVHAEPTLNSLSDVIARVKLKMPSPFEARASSPCPDCSQINAVDSGPCARCGCGAQVTESGTAAVPAKKTRHVSRKAKWVGTACLLAEDPARLETSLVQEWVVAQEEAGHAVKRQATALMVYFHFRSKGTPGRNQEMVRALAGLAGSSDGHRSGLRVGFCLASGGTTEDDAEYAKRLAGVAPRGGMVIPSTQQGALRVRARALTDTYLPCGAALRCALVASESEQGPSDRVLYGRTSVLRRLGAIEQSAEGKGLTRVLLTGDRGVGKTAVLHEFAAEQEASIILRVAPLGLAWPGHTFARLAMAALGAGSERDPDILARLYAAKSARVRRVLDALVRSEEGQGGFGGSWLTASGIASGVYDLLREFAGDARLSLVLDDYHCVDAASLALLDELMELCRNEDWCVIVAGLRAPLRGMLRHKEWVECPLRPLGLRASTQLLESVGAPRDRIGHMTEWAGGNPLALKLLAANPSATASRPAKVIEHLLPAQLQGLPVSEAELAWDRAVHGEYMGDDLGAHAAKLYLEVASTPQIREWLATRIKEAGGVFGSMVCGWRPLTRSHFLARAGRHELLGLFHLASAEYLQAARYTQKTHGVWERLQSARMRARMGEGKDAIVLYKEAIEIGLTVAHTGELLDLGACLQAASLDEAAMEVLEAARGGIVKSSGSQEESGRLLALLARGELRRFRVPQSLEYLGRCNPLVEDLRHDDARAARGLEALIQEVRAEIAVADGDVDGARFNLRKACDAYRDLGCMIDSIRALLALGQVELDANRHSLAVDTFTACVALSTSQGLSREGAFANVGLGRSLLLVGRSEEGTTLLRTVLRTRRFAQFEAVCALGHAMVGRALLADAERYADRARSLAKDDGQHGRALYLLSLAQQHPTQAARFLDESRDRFRRAGNGLILARLPLRQERLRTERQVSLGPDPR